MAKNRNKSAPATPEVTAEPTKAPEATSDTPPAAPADFGRLSRAATDASPESAGPGAEPAGRAAPPVGGEPPAPPDFGELSRGALGDGEEGAKPQAGGEEHPPLPGSIDVSVQTDRS